MPGFHLTPEERARHAALSPVQPTGSTSSPPIRRRSRAPPSPRSTPRPSWIRRRSNPGPCSSTRNGSRRSSRRPRNLPLGQDGSGARLRHDRSGWRSSTASPSRSCAAPPRCSPIPIACHNHRQRRLHPRPAWLRLLRVQHRRQPRGVADGPWKDRFRSQRLVAGFLAEQRLRVLPLNPLDALLSTRSRSASRRASRPKGNSTLPC